MNRKSMHSQGGGPDIHHFDDFLDTSSDDSDSDPSDSFACDDEAGDDFVALEVDAAFQDKNMRNKMVDRIKGMVKQSSNRSLFSSASGSLQNKLSGEEFSNSEEGVGSQVVSQKSEKSRPTIGIMRRGSVRSMFSGTSASFHQELGSESSDHSDEEVQEASADKDDENEKNNRPERRSGMLKSKSTRGMFKRSSSGGELEKEKDRSEKNEKNKRRSSLLTATSMRSLMSMGNSYKQELKSGFESFNERDDSSSTGISLPEEVAKPSPGKQLRRPSGPSQRSDIQPSGSNHTENRRTDERDTHKDKTDSPRSESQGQKDGSGHSKNKVYRFSNKLEKDGQDSRSTPSHAIKERKDELRSKSSHIRRKPREHAQSLSGRTMHAPTRRFISRHKSEDMNAMASFLGPSPRVVSRHKSEDMNAMAAMASSFADKGQTRGNGKNLEHPNGRRHRRQRSAKSDPGDILAMAAAIQSSFGDFIEDHDDVHNCSSAILQTSARRSLSVSQMSLPDDGDNAIYCERTVASHVSDLSCDFGDFESVADEDFAEEEPATAKSLNKRAIVGPVPLSISCNSEKASKNTSSRGTSPTDLLSEHSAHSNTGLRSSCRKNPRSSSKKENKNHGVSLPCHVTKSRDEDPVSRSFRRRKHGKPKECRSDAYTFQIDQSHPLVRSKSRGTSEYVELNISCHDGKSLASLVSINA